MSEDEKYPKLLKASTINDNIVYRRSDDGVVATLSPTYKLSPGAPPAIPSGEILVRFSADTDASRCAELIESAGYRIVRDLPWATHAIMVQSISGTLADTLNHIHALEALPGVENVEPQMTSERSMR